MTAAIQKRKAHLNLSGSHRLLDADSAMIGGDVFVTGSVHTTGSIHAGGGLTGSIHHVDPDGTMPFIVGGPHITASFNSDGQWEITGSEGATVGGSDSQVQFNQNGHLDGDPSFTFVSGSVFVSGSGVLGVANISGSSVDNTWSSVIAEAVGGTADGFEAVKFTTPVVVSDGALVLDGRQHLGGPNYFGGLVVANGAGIQAYSGSFDPNGSAYFELSPDSNGDSNGSVGLRGSLRVMSGSVSISAGSELYVLSGSSESGYPGFRVYPDTTDDKVVLESNGINIMAITGSVTSDGINPTSFDSNLLQRNLAGHNGSVAKFKVEILGASTDGADFFSTELSITAMCSTGGAVSVIGATETDTSHTAGAASWDVNINSDATIALTASNGATPVAWYAQVTKKMVLSGSLTNNILY